ncbi:hypothetical protein LWI29_016458 [Acer saccharum]|uniref:Uncharacterized protein n=1 Tax=Acer saccharum TaxID=4024 RepID=A0AA39TC96_ACESA|nr:hypothetical protein LWI29_016458 [Acer saccharum]
MIIWEKKGYSDEITLADYGTKLNYVLILSSLYKGVDRSRLLITAGETPLYLAAERGYVEVLDEILHTCFSPADHGPYSRTALNAAVISFTTSMTTSLLEDKRINKSGKDQQ